MEADRKSQKLFHFLTLQKKLLVYPWFKVSLNKVAIPRGPCQQNFFTWVLIQAFSDIEKAFLFSNLVALTAKSENEGFSTSEKAWITQLPG